MKKSLVYQILSVLTALLTFTVNVLASVLPINGQGTGEISDRFAIYFVPAGYVFSIWGIIYLGLIAFTIYQALPGQRGNSLLERISPAYWISNLANTVWIFLWHYEVFSLTPVFMFTILASLLFIYIQLAKSDPPLNTRQKWLVKLPFSIYLGWISVAMVANVTQVLFYYGWGGWGLSAEVWAVVMLAVAMMLGLAMYWREKDLAYALVLVWALVGIAQKQVSSQLVSTSAWGAAGILALALLVVPLVRKRA